MENKREWMSCSRCGPTKPAAGHVGMRRAAKRGISSDSHGGGHCPHRIDAQSCIPTVRGFSLQKMIIMG